MRKGEIADIAPALGHMPSLPEPFDLKFAERKMEMDFFAKSCYRDHKWNSVGTYVQTVWFDQ